MDEKDIKQHKDPIKDAMEEKELGENKPDKTAIGITEQIDYYRDRLVIRKKGLSNMLKVTAELKPKDILIVKIKPSGTLYDGYIELYAGTKMYKVAFKNYQQAEFEEIKGLLGR